MSTKAKGPLAKAATLHSVDKPYAQGLNKRSLGSPLCGGMGASRWRWDSPVPTIAARGRCKRGAKRGVGHPGRVIRDESSSAMLSAVRTWTKQGRVRQQLGQPKPDRPNFFHRFGRGRLLHGAGIDRLGGQENAQTPPWLLLDAPPQMIEPQNTQCS